MGSTFSRSLLVGAVATLTDLFALWLLIDGAQVSAIIANVPALLAGVAVQFIGNKSFAFRDPSRDWLRQGAQFAAVELGTIALNALAFHLLVTLSPIPYAGARLLGSALVYVAFSYPLWARIFRSPAGGAT